jgi:DNA gyrase subunit A
MEETAPPSPENTEPVTIENEMRTSYMDYAMSVIIGRALPDIRDGLKPVHRRVLYSMHQLRNTWNTAYKKSARVVGDCIGQYHPHGDQAVYDTIVRMAQDFSMRGLLVDGQGNFGSVDGDPAAAMRYTEIRMTRLAGELLDDLDKDTVDFQANYDGSTQEPSVLPARVPNLLVNGSGGIAVGMATNIPPHNLGEVIDGAIELINRPETTIEELMELIPGPDFPTGAFIHGRAGIESAYKTGRGIIKLRARVDIESTPEGKESIIVTELPYQVNKARLLEQIAGLVREKRIEGIAHIQDESDRQGMRMVIDLKRDAFSQIVLNQLFSMTPMQSSFGVINLAIVDGQPKVFKLREMLTHFIDHRRDVVTRRSLFLLAQAEARAHLLEGYQIALDNIDAIVELIKGSPDPASAKLRLIDAFSLSERQSQAILDMRLQRLTGLERDKILAELAEMKEEIKALNLILDNERRLLDVIVEELSEIKEKYADPRRTVILEQSSDLSIEDLIAEEDMAVTVSHAGYIKRMAVSAHRAQHRGGKGRRGASTKESDVIVDLFVANTHTPLLIFTDRGRVFKLKVWQLPEGGPQSRGKPVINLFPVEKDEKIRTILPVAEWTEEKAIVFATRNGLVKKTPLFAYNNVLSRGIIAINLVEGDDLVTARLVEPGQHVLLGSREGKSIRFDEADARPMGRGTRGVRGMRLGNKDELIGMEILDEGAAILTVTSNGFGKRTATSEYRVQSRGGKGIITIKTGGRNGDVVALRQVHGDEDLLMVTNHGQLIRTPVEQVSMVGRNTMGVRLFKLDKKAELVAVECVPAAEDEEELDGEFSEDAPDAPTGTDTADDAPTDAESDDAEVGETASDESTDDADDA